MSEDRDFLLKPISRPIHSLAAEICSKHDVTLAQLQSPIRMKHIVRARWELMYRANREIGATLPRIGHFLNRDHTTVLHGIRRHVAHLETV